MLPLAARQGVEGGELDGLRVLSLGVLVCRWRMVYDDGEAKAIACPHVVELYYCEI